MHMPAKHVLGKHVHAMNVLRSVLGHDPRKVTEHMLQTESL